jgi:hypothetical protein
MTSSFAIMENDSLKESLIATPLRGQITTKDNQWQVCDMERRSYIKASL